MKQLVALSGLEMRASTLGRARAFALSFAPATAIEERGGTSSPTAYGYEQRRSSSAHWLPVTIELYTIVSKNFKIGNTDRTATSIACPESLNRKLHSMRVHLQRSVDGYGIFDGFTLKGPSRKIQQHTK